MKLFIGRIPPDVSADQIKEHFSQFGKVTDLILKGPFGFLGFESDSSIEAALDQGTHVVGRAQLAVERARGKRMFESDNPDRYYDSHSRSPPRDYRGGYDRKYERSPPRYGGRYDDRYGSRSPGYNGYRGSDYPDRERERERDRQYCDYCSRCERHGTYPRGSRDYSDSRKRLPPREHPNSHLKIVFENLPTNTTTDGFRNFIKENGYEPAFARVGLAGNHGIIEFKSVDEKDDAMKKFDGFEFDGSILKTRSYMTKDEYKNSRGWDSAKTDQSNTAPEEEDKNGKDETDLYTGIDDNIEEAKEDKTEV